MAQILPGNTTDLTCQSCTDLDSTFSLAIPNPEKASSSAVPIHGSTIAKKFIKYKTHKI